MDWRNTEVEVDLPNGACYQASIKDITESGILVVFKDDLKPETSVRFENVRLLPHQDEDSFDFKQGDIIQVYSKADEDQVEGWWKAKIQALKGDNYFIEYIDRDGMDLVKKDNIRPVKQGDCFRKLLVKVPKNLKAICEEAGIHTEFIKHSGVLAVIYSRTSSSLIFVSTSEYLNKKAELLADLHVKALKEKLQQRQYREKYKHTETFMVTSDLMGLAIGTKGANIMEAERIKGIGSVTKVECDDGYLFKISGEDIVYSGNICTVDISFEIIDEHMYGNVCDDTASATNRVDDTASATNRVDVRRLSTPSFGERYLSVDSYLTQWRWYWKNDHDVWLLFDTDLQIYTLEVKYMNQQRTYLFSRENYEQKYRLSFSSMKQVNIEYGTTREIMRRPLFVSKEDIQKKNHPKKIVSTAIDGEESKPAHFYPWDLANEFELVEIPFSFTSEYNDVLSSFHETMSEENYEVRSILRVQSKKLWSEFEIKKKQLYADAEKYNPTFSAIDERSLFHGTNSLDVCRGICINNFDFRKSGKNATDFGEGSYFARKAKYSHNYTKASSDFGDRYMFRAKVLVGKFTQGSSAYRRPPEIPGQSHKLYDSCVNNPINPNIFVIFDRSQSYPEYLINYREKDYEQRRISSRTTHSSVPSYPLTGGTSQQPIHQRMPTKIAAYTSRGTSLGIAQKPLQPSMQPTSSTAYPSGGTSLGVARKPVQSSTHSIPSYLRTSLGISQRPVQSSMHSTRSTAYSSGGTNLGVPRKQVQTNMHSLSSTGHSSVGNSLGVSRKPVQSSIHSASSTGHSSGRTSSGFARTTVQSSIDSARSTANSSGEISSGTAAKYNPVPNSSSSMMNSSSSSSSTSFQPFDHSNVSSGSSQPSSSQNSISTNTNQDRDCVIL